VALDYGHGNNQACVGCIDGQHMIFGGEEWWWYGTHVRPGDQLFQERIFTGYKVSDTEFAGPTLFQRGEPREYLFRHGQNRPAEKGRWHRCLGSQEHRIEIAEQGNSRTAAGRCSQGVP
jgi:hypothetical protein